MYRRPGEPLAWPQTAVLLLAALCLLAACKSAGIDLPATLAPAAGQPVAAAATRPQTATATPTPTPPPSRTPTAAPSATPSPTPSPTAVPIAVTGDPRAAVLRDPVPQENARCGVVDLLDFPLDPPDALTVAYGGQGFGRFRRRYDLFHAGEDWQLVRGRSNLGVPVYAIGHGRVTYAQPLGWGRDQGVIIVRHTFVDGHTVLSFYGHLDPDSVTLRAGDCVVRGQQIGAIGQPRTPPHLHFEIRTHLPDEPGRGYWPEDPTTAGWLPPSPFIWRQRMAAMPGVAWTRPAAAGGAQRVGLAPGGTLILREADRLVGLDGADGHLRWQRPLTDTVAALLVDGAAGLLYTADRLGQVAAYPLPAAGAAATGPLWQVDLGAVGSPTLLPLPDGGLVVSLRQDAVALSAQGETLWRAGTALRPYEWLQTAGGLILTGSGQEGPVYTATAAGLQAWPVARRGRPAAVGDQLWLLADEGLYRLDPAALTAELLYPLPLSPFGPGSIVPLPEGGALIARQEWGDGRLIDFGPDGAVRWQRALGEVGPGNVQLALHGGRPYLLLTSGRDEATQLKLYAVNRERSTLRHLFTGGTRDPLPGGEWLLSLSGNLLLINVGGGPMAALDPTAAVSLLDAAGH